MKPKAIIAGLILSMLFLPNAAAIAQHTEDEALKKTAREIYDLIMCPICSGQTIAQSSSETSRQMRDLVLKKLRQGESKEEVLQYFVSRYGERIMAEPSKRGLNLMLWFLPFGLLAFTAILIFSLIRRWSIKAAQKEAPDLENTQLSEYQARLEKELEEFDRGS